MKKQFYFDIVNGFCIIASNTDDLQIQCSCGKWNKPTAWSCKSCGKPPSVIIY